MEKSLIFPPTGINQQSLLCAINNFVQAVDAMDNAVMIPSRLQDMEMSTDTTGASGGTETSRNQALLPVGTSGTDLYGFYQMLKTIKRDIISGEGNLRDRLSGSSSESDDADVGDDSTDAARKTAAAFRYHLNGLFDMLHQFTETAKILSRRYESEVGLRY